MTFYLSAKLSSTVVEVIALFDILRCLKFCVVHYDTFIMESLYKAIHLSWEIYSKIAKTKFC